MIDVGKVLLYFFIEFTKLWLVLWGIINFPLKKNKRVYIVTGGVLFFIIIVAGMNFEQYESTIKQMLSALVIFIICIIFNGKIIRKLTYSLLAYVCILFADLCVAGIISLLLNTTLFNIVNHYTLNNVCNAFNIVTFSVVIFIRKIRKSSAIRLALSKKIYALLFAGAGIGSLFIGCLMITTLPGAGERIRRTMIVVTIIICFAYCIACLMLVIVSDSRDNFKSLSQINQNVIVSQQRYYMLVQEKQREIQSLRHEMKNHLGCINSLHHNNKLTEMDQYINQLMEQTGAVEDLFDTGNDIVNAILNDAQSRYQKEGIRIALEGTFPKGLHIAPMDLCVIFANAVSNAVEAIQRIERSIGNIYIIHIRLSSFKEDLYIDITNPTEKKVEIPKGNPVTSKQDKNIHGFGTKNMRLRVEKYQGTINFKSEDNVFYVEIHMKNKVKN